LRYVREVLRLSAAELEELISFDCGLSYLTTSPRYGRDLAFSSPDSAKTMKENDFRKYYYPCMKLSFSD